MPTIEQAREVSSRLWITGHVDESATIDVLIAELAALKEQEPVAWVGDISEGSQLLLDQPARWEAVPLFLAAGAQPAQAQASYTTLPERDTTKPAEQQGLFKKFMVKRVDDSDDIGGKHYGCEYFVLDVDHDQHAPNALRAYATACAETHPKLSADLKAMWGAQERKPLTDEQITEVWRELRAQKEDWSDLDFARAIEAYIKEQPMSYALLEAVDALLSNEEHATSGGMRSYQVGSHTWELWEDLRKARLALLAKGS